MNKLCLDLTNCYGIKKLQAQFDFSSGSTYAIYAPNGSMKSSLARTFRDVTTGTEPKDRYHPNLSSSSKITDENGRDLPKESILVVDPYDREFDLTDRTSTLLVNRTLRDEYAQLLIEIDASKKKLLKALGEQSASKKDLGREISLTFTNKDDNFLAALLSINGQLLAQVGAPFADVPYDTIFDQTVLEFLETKDFRTVIAD